MKKVTTKLTLSKQTLASLDQQQMAAAKGGFTYSFSLDERCIKSARFGDVGQCRDKIQ
ncbi:class I lanthipeptide [Hymenobacter actinosclerus]|uniref:class I lanthipeptide n=1 Tax=Hymenobacter actinosclerus TaxID=82805 RepID=UPI00373FCD54